MLFVQYFFLNFYICKKYCPKIETNFLNTFDNLIIFGYFTFDTFKLVHYNKITISVSIYFTKIAVQEKEVI